MRLWRFLVMWWDAANLAALVWLLIHVQRICAYYGHKTIIHHPDGRIVCTACHARLDDLPRRDPRDVIAEFLQARATRP